jgi:2'-5' RNA ligase
MNTYRLFVAVNLPESVKDQLSDIQTGVDGASWVKRPTIHLTLRFLGDGIAADRLDRIIAALGQIEVAPFELHLAGVGRFPPSGKRSARILWVGIDEQPALTKLLQPAIERAVVSVDFPPDDKPFRGHITLARLKKPVKGEAIPNWLARQETFRSDPIPVNEFVLYSSLLTPQGPIYTAEATFPLA